MQLWSKTLLSPSPLTAAPLKETMGCLCEFLPLTQAAFHRQSPLLLGRIHMHTFIIYYNGSSFPIWNLHIFSPPFSTNTKLFDRSHAQIWLWVIKYTQHSILLPSAQNMKSVGLWACVDILSVNVHRVIHIARANKANTGTASGSPCSGVWHICWMESNSFARSNKCTYKVLCES